MAVTGNNAGSFNGTYPQYATPYIFWSYDQSIPNNNTVLTVELKVKREKTGSTTNKSSAPWSIDIGGTVTSGSISFKIANVSAGDYITIGSATKTIVHNDDGSCGVVKISATINLSGTTLGTGNVSASVTPYTIARASEPSLVTWPDTTQEVTIGSTITIHMNKKANFTHTVKYYWGNRSETIATGVVDNCEWTIPNDLMNYIPNANSGIGTIEVDTYSGSTLIGTKSVGFTGIVPDSVVPSISSVSISEANSEVGLGVYVQGKSALNVVISASGSYSSSITSYRITGIDNITYNQAKFTSSTLQQATTYKIAITVTDSRSRTTSVEKQITCIAYANPKINSATVTRCNADGTVNQQGTYVKYTFKAEISPISNKNTPTYRLGYKKSTDDYYTYIDIANDSYTIDKEDVILTDLTFTTNNSYDFQFVVTDYFTTTPYVASIGTGFKLMNFNKSGKAMAIGKMSEAGEDEELFEVGLPTIIREKIIFDNYIENSQKEFSIPIDIGLATGWYLALSGTMTGYDSRSFLLAIEQVHMGGAGLLYVCLRCDNTTSIYSPQYFWLTNRGIDNTNVQLKLDGNNFYLYLKTTDNYQQYHVSVLSEKILGSSNYGLFEINKPTYSDTLDDPEGNNPE